MSMDYKKPEIARDLSPPDEYSPNWPVEFSPV
jgi:hypothetical protein